MRPFWAGLIRDVDGKASMARGLTWLTFAVIAVSWFVFPERSISELTLIFGALLGYAIGGKIIHGKQEEDKDAN